MSETNCPLCGRKLIFRGPDQSRFADFVNCPNCGKYSIDTTRMLPDEDRHLLAGYLFEVGNIDKKSDFPFIDSETIKKISSSSIFPKTMSDRLLKLLAYINRNTKQYGESVSIPKEAAYAKNENELYMMLEDLDNHKLISTKYATDVDLCAYITLDGFEYIANRKIDTKQSQCFVAMWFADEMTEVFNNAIKPACLVAGYDARIVSIEQFNGDIIDQILAGIRNSHFVIADLTGDRGGVYYEAGFAKGLGKEVILTCREDWFNHPEINRKVHFDVNHNNIIVWKEIDELRQRLQDRIIATLGKGSYLGD